MMGMDSASSCCRYDRLDDFINLALSHIKWVTLPSPLTGSAQKYPHYNSPPSEGEEMTGCPTFSSPPLTGGD